MRNRKKIISILLGGLLLNCPHAWSSARALLIGIDQYEHVTDLSGSQNDVKKMEKLATDVWGYEPDSIKLLFNEAASYRGITDAIEQWLINGTKPGDDVLFFYSGHGYQQKDENQEEPDQLDETLVAYDTALSENNQVINMITDDEIDRLFNRMDDRNVTMIIDSCHSGTITRGMGSVSHNEAGLTDIKTPSGLPPAFKISADNKDLILEHRNEVGFVPKTGRRIVWTAVSSAQQALVDRDSTVDGSVFTNLFYAGLKEKKADMDGSGNISQGELLDYVQQHSQAYCGRHPDQCKFGLTPSLEAPMTSYSRQLDKPVLPDPATGTVMPEQQQTTIDVARSLLTHENIAGLQIEVLPARPLKIGENLKIAINSQSSGYLVVLDVSPNGKLTQLFPNQYSDRVGKSNKIEQQVPLLIPDIYYGFELEITEPLGQGTLIAMISEDPVDLSTVLSEHKDLEFIGDATGYLTRLSERMRRVWREDRYNRATKWSVAETNYVITSK